MVENYCDFIQFYSGSAPINLIEKGDEQCEKNYSVKRGSSPIYALEYIVEGRNDYIINGITIHAFTGDIILLPKKSVHSYGNVKDFPCRKQWVIFDGSMARHLLNCYLLEGRYCYRCTQAADIFEEIMTLFASSQEEYFAAVKKFSLLLHSLLLDISFNNDFDVKNDESIEMKIKRYIDENIKENLTTQKIADEFHYSKNHTIILFRNRFGITPKQYLIERKIELACLYLRNTTIPIKTISDILSFADQHYFSNVFLKIKKVTPSQFRKSSQYIDSDGEKLNFISKNNNKI